MDPTALCPFHPYSPWRRKRHQTADLIFDLISDLCQLLDSFFNGGQLWVWLYELLLISVYFIGTNYYQFIRECMDDNYSTI